MKHLLDKAILYIMLAMLAMMSVVMYFMIFEGSEVTFSNIPFPVDQEVYQPDDKINITIKECSDNPIRYTYNTSLVNEDTGEAMLTGIMSRQASGEGCKFVEPISVIVPEGIDEGQYYMLLNVLSEGAFRSVIYDTANSETFDIVNSN